MNFKLVSISNFNLDLKNGKGTVIHAVHTEILRDRLNIYKLLRDLWRDAYRQEKFGRILTNDREQQGR